MPTSRGRIAARWPSGSKTLSRAAPGSRSERATGGPRINSVRRRDHVRDAAADRARTALRPRRGSLVGDQREQIVRGKLAPPFQELQLDDEGKPLDFPAEPLDEVRGRRGGAARREDVVDDGHSFPRANRIAVDLERLFPVLELIGLALDVPGELSL